MDDLLKSHEKYIAKGVKYMETQNPHTVVLTCSDSRVIPEYIFDQDIGNFFTLRVAGNVLDDVVCESIEYAVAHFNVQRIIVMGHEKCGAVKATLDHYDNHDSKLINIIKRGINKSDEYNAAIKKNTLKQAKSISQHFKSVQVFAYVYKLNGELEHLKRFLTN